MVTTTSAANAARRAVILLSNPSLVGQSVATRSDTFGNFPIPARPRWVYPAAGLLVHGRSNGAGRRRGGAGALVCRAGAGRNPAATSLAVAGWPDTSAGGTWCDQPGHRGIDLGRPGAARRILPHARAVHGRKLSVSGETRLRPGRCGRGRTGGDGRPQRFCALSPSEQVRRAG